MFNTYIYYKTIVCEDRNKSWWWWWWWYYLQVELGYARLKCNTELYKLCNRKFLLSLCIHEDMKTSGLLKYLWINFSSSYFTVTRWRTFVKKHSKVERLSKWNPTLNWRIVLKVRSDFLRVLPKLIILKRVLKGCFACNHALALSTLVRLSTTVTEAQLSHIQ